MTAIYKERLIIALKLLLVMPFLPLVGLAVYAFYSIPGLILLWLLGYW